ADGAFAADAEAQTDAVRIDSRQQAIGRAEIASGAKPVQIGAGAHAPDDLTQGRPLLHRRRQRWIVGLADEDLAAVQRLEVEAIAAFTHQLQAPVEEKAPAVGDVLDAVGDAIDAFDVGHGDLPLTHPRCLDQGSEGAAWRDLLSTISRKSWRE